MPELPEVERAKELVKSLAKGKIIHHVVTKEDLIVFADITHEEFALELVGRKVTDVVRYGKVFYIEVEPLQKKVRMPVLHFGMTGMIQVKGQRPIHYREAPRKVTDEWPPKFTKFVLHLKSPDDPHAKIIELAFLDARRLGRIRLCRDPPSEPPISALGFDPIFSMPDINVFKQGVLKRSCPIKALLLDQTFSAGVGNWVADEILYHARVHPERRCNTLREEELVALHDKMQFVCKTAVSVNADDSQFPDDWLFKHRWDKGKKGKKTKEGLKLPSGDPATIKWVTVGGRTSAFVVELQTLSGNAGNALEDTNEGSERSDSDSELTPLEDEEAAVVQTRRPKRKVKQAVSVEQATTGKKRRSSRKAS